MYLKRIDVENFKSFGKKLSIPFLEGFTSITGPNGSGKSNIGDAILFVLGPKSSKAIRAQNLTDLIFNGGKEKKPARECRVTLVFDNADRAIPVEGEEVTFTRLVRLSKTNKDNYYSYYYVNGESSTATEFDELLAHARISADGYNIVQQGDVTRIVEMGNLDRRRILDDIAGITQFDHDIEKADGERAEVEENLDRIRIVLDEIDRQLRTLEREKEAAERYREVKEQLDLEKAKLARKRKEGLEVELANVEEQIRAYEEEREGLVARLEELRGDAREAQGEVERIEAEIADKGGDEARELKERIDAIKQDMVRHTERVNYSRVEIQELKKERATVEGDLARVEKQAKGAEKERTEAADERDERQGELDDHVDELETLRDQLTQSTGRVSDLQRNLAQLKQRYERAQDDLHEAKLERDRTADRRERLRQAVAEAEEKVETQAFEVKDAGWELKELQKASKSDAGDVEELEQELLELKKREAEISEQLRDLEPAIRRLQNRYSQLKAEQEASENVARGYTRAVEAVMEARDRGELDGICGTVAELATVDPKYETALEIAAGGRLQAVVTETDADAARAIDLLKRKKVGRVTFLPLSKIQPRKPRGKAHMAVRDDDAEGFALDLVQFDAKYEPAFWYVLRDTVIVKDLNTARRLMGGVRLVTLDGDLVDAGGAMTGGQSRGGSRLKFGQSRQEDLEKAGRELRAAVAHQEKLTDERLEVREQLEAAQDRLRDLRGDHESATGRLEELERLKEEGEARLATLREALETRRGELAEAGEALEAAEAHVTELEADLERLDGEREAAGERVLQATNKETAQELQRLEATVADLRDAVRDAQSRVETAEQKIALIAERRDELTERLQGIDAEVAEHQQAIEEHGERKEALEGELDELLAREAEQNDELQALRDERDEAVERKLEIENRCGKVSDKIDTTGDLMVGLQSRLPALEERLAEATFELSGYEVELPQEIPESQEDLRATVRSLEGALDRLGDVNMRAIEEYDRQAARKEDLTGEFERLEEQRINLIDLVEEIMGKKRERFFEVFEEIGGHFQEVFARLSDGGKARLELEDPERPFEGGLVMKAQPKGKKVTRLEALSGGEKGLTSMAFILAIQEWEPSPFYYFDEVDQNLDGVNSELLARLIKANSHTSQIIVVSLRKVTLKEADHVYGVTMTESGISEIVGEVNIAEIVEEPAPGTEEVAA